MKRSLITALLFGMCSSASSMVPASAHANNHSVESALAGYSDVSVFYQALLNTGVAAELSDNVHYTIFAPTNEAFAQIRPDAYPCFYSAQCRAQVADILRNHIAIGNKTLKELTRETEVPTIGRNLIYAESPFIYQYTVGNRDVLSGEELNGNMIYRIDGVILNNAQLAQFRTVPPVVGSAETGTTYHAPVSYAVPGGEGVSTLSIYPDGTQVTTIRHTYVMPGEYPDNNGNETSTVTRTITSEQ